MRVKLTSNFYLHEFEVSQTASRYGLDNKIPNNLRDANRTLAESLQILRDELNAYYTNAKISIFISSGFRSVELNSIIGGAENSQHMRAEAADISATGLTPRELFEFIKYRPKLLAIFDKVILEPTWVHLSAVKENPRNILMRAIESVDEDGSKFMTYKVVNV